MMKPDQDEFRKGLGFSARIGTEMVATTVVGSGLGYGLDKWLGTSPWLMVLGLVLGGVAGILGVYRLASRDNQK